MKPVMITARLALAGVLVLSGLGIGVLWSPLAGSSRVPPNVHDVFAAKSEHEKYVAKMRQLYGVETGVFLKQFEDMNIHVNKYPVDAWASPDGRFVIRVFGNEQTIASDLYYPDRGGEVKDVVREYSFSSGGHTFTCSFARSIKDPKVTEVQFRRIDAKGRESVYVDFDADGRWDKFVDYTQDPPISYRRDGLCWKETARYVKDIWKQSEPGEERGQGKENKTER